MTLVKICGIRTVAEGRAALRAGAHWLGFVLWEPSKRSVSVEAAAGVIATLRAEFPAWAAVGVYVDPTREQVDHSVAACGLDYVQLSGHEEPAFVRALPYPTLKALHVRHGGEEEAARLVRDNPFGADLFLLDTHADGMYGGTGAAFDWVALRSVGATCFVAGGLRPDNVRAALATLAPRGVDVSSGVEYPQGGKDPRLVQAFLEAVSSHDAHLTPSH